MMEKMKEYEIASTKQRIGALILDYLIIFFVWYLFTKKDLYIINDLMKVIDPDIVGSLDVLVEGIFKLYVSFIFKWIVVSTVIYTVIPAIFGNGKTLGKILLGISVINDENDSEVSPTKLIIREFIGRNLVESLLIIPGIISVFMVIFRKDSKSIHDLMSRTLVVKSSSISTY